jgi:predicted nucleic acid-binding protein
MIVVSNTSPLNYLILIEAIDILPKLFGTLTIPSTVCKELQHPDAPIPVQIWASHLPDWINVQPTSLVDTSLLQWLDPGETEAILLAQELDADLVLLDDLQAREIAKKQGLQVTGIIGLLDRAASQRLIDLPNTIQKLQQTSFWVSDRLLQELLKKHQ